MGHDTTRPEVQRVGLEIAESGARLAVTLSAAPDARRWQARLSAQPTPAEALDAIHTLIARTLREDGAHDEQAAALMATDGQPTVEPFPEVACAIGVAFGGALDAAQGRTHETFGARLAPGWEGFPLGERLAARCGGPVRVETVTNAAALAEAQLGAGRGYDGVLYALLGRGVTSALVVGGRVWRGAQGRAGMLGHWLVYPSALGAETEATLTTRCICGLRGHLDPIASAQSMTRIMIGRASDSDESMAAMLRISGRRAEAMTAPQVVELAAAGDPAATSVVDEALDALAVTFANLITTLDPGVIVIGGPLANAGDRFYAPLRARVAALCAPYRLGVAPPAIVGGALEPSAALRGAALLAP